MGRQSPVGRKARRAALPAGHAETTDQVSFGTSGKERAFPSFDQNSFDRCVCISCATPRKAIKELTHEMQEAVVCRRLRPVRSASVVEYWNTQCARRRSCLSYLRGRSDG